MYSTSDVRTISILRLLLPAAEAGFQLPVASLSAVSASRCSVGGFSSASRCQLLWFFEIGVSLLRSNKLSPLWSLTVSQRWYNTNAALFSCLPFDAVLALTSKSPFCVHDWLTPTLTHNLTNRAAEGSGHRQLKPERGGL